MRKIVAFTLFVCTSIFAVNTLAAKYSWSCPTTMGARAGSKGTIKIDFDTDAHWMRVQNIDLDQGGWHSGEIWEGPYQGFGYDSSDMIYGFARFNDGVHATVPYDIFLVKSVKGVFGADLMGVKCNLIPSSQ